MSDPVAFVRKWDCGKLDVYCAKLGQTFTPDQPLYTADAIREAVAAERDAQAQPVNVEGPEHLAPRPAPGLVFDARGVLVPVKDAPVAWVQPDHLQKLRDGSFLCRCSPIMIHDFVPLYAAPQPPDDVPRMTDAEYVKIAFPYLDGALMETVELDGYALLEILRAVEDEVRRRVRGAA